MLPKRNRLKRKRDFEMVFKEGKGFREGFLFLKIRKNGLENTRIGFVVSKKISKKATVRNKIKRRLRALVRNQLSFLKSGWDMVLVALPGLEKKDFWQMQEDLNKIFLRAKIFKK